MMFWQAELKNLLQQLQSYREAQTADEQANAVHQGALHAVSPPTCLLSLAQRVILHSISASTVASLVGAAQQSLLRERHLVA